MLTLVSIGGYGEYHRNSTAIIYENQCIFLDSGVKLLNSKKVYPDYATFFKKHKNLDVKGILISHAHLDHIGALNGLSQFVPDSTIVYTTKYSADIIKNLKLWNKLFEIIEPELTYSIGSFTVSAHNVQHSIPSTTCFLITADRVTTIYLSDFKIDNFGTLHCQNVTDHTILKDADYMIVDVTRAAVDERTPSELIAKSKLTDTIAHCEKYCGGNIFVGCFGSNIARINALQKIAVEKKYDIYLVGKCFKTYAAPAIQNGYIEDIKIVSSNYSTFFSNLETNKNIFVVSGSQGEPNSVLTRIISGDISYEFSKRDTILFSAKTIPDKYIILNRTNLLNHLNIRNLVYYDNLHVSGHASLSDLINVIKVLRPKNIIPTHGTYGNMGLFCDKLIAEARYNKRQIHFLGEFQKFLLKK